MTKPPCWMNLLKPEQPLLPRYGYVLSARPLGRAGFSACSEIGATNTDKFRDRTAAK